MKECTNPHAERCAQMICGKYESYRGLHLVTYSYGSAPSLIYWRGKEQKYVRDLHFITTEMRDVYLAKLKKQQDIPLFSQITQRLRKHLLNRVAEILA